MYQTDTCLKSWLKYYFRDLEDLAGDILKKQLSHGSLKMTNPLVLWIKEELFLHTEGVKVIDIHRRISYNMFMLLGLETI